MSINNCILKTKRIALPSFLLNALTKQLLYHKLFSNHFATSKRVIYISLFLLASITSNGQVSVTATAGTTGPTSYTTLKLAFDAVNTGTHQGSIAITIIGNTTETISASLNASGTGSSSYTNLSITPSGGVPRTISGAIVAGSSLINLNGADNVTIDGLNSGGNGLSFSNTTVSNIAGTSTIRFIGDASNNTIQNCTIAGSETTASSGVVFFSTGTTTGNDSNSISNCTITAAGTNLPTNAIYSAGTSVAIDNSGNSIFGCAIQDYFNSTVSSTGILVASNSAAWTITNNKFFQTATRTTAANGLVYRAIRIITASAGNYTITNNTIGFANALGTGNTIYNGNFTTAFRGIELAANTTLSSIQGNTISGINFTTSNGATGSPGIFSGIAVTNGAVNLGTTTGNTIGSTTQANAIVVTSSAVVSSRIDGIYVSSTSTTSAIQNNFIGGITTGGGAPNGYSMVALYTSGTSGNFTTTNNVIGSTSIANSIAMGTAGITTTGVCNFYGIFNNATGSISMNNNAILKCAVFGAGASFYYGIYNNGGIGAAVTMNTNIIDDASLSGTNVMRGIYNGIAASTLSISNNTIRNLKVNSTGSSVTGILNAGAVSATIAINNNKLGDATSGLLTYSVASTAVFYGILNSSGTSATALTIQGNDIRGITHSVAGSSSHNYIVNNFATRSQNISTNTFTNLNVSTTGNVVFISNNVALPASGTQIVSSNAIVGTYTKSSTGGTVTVFFSAATSNASAIITNNSNNFSNITVSGTTILSGWNQRDLGLTAKTVNGNIFNNWSAGTGTITGMIVNGFGLTSSVNTNTVTYLTGQRAINGISVGTTGNASSFSITSNAITNLSSTGTGGNVVALIAANPSVTVTVNNNIISTLSSTAVSATVNGIQVSGGTGTQNVRGNNINGFTATGTTNPILNGILISGGTTVNLSKNKIYNLAQNGASTGGVVNGIAFTGGTAVTAFNNIIGELKAPTVSNTHAIRGISVNSSVASSTYTVSYNTVYLNATSTGTNFGTEALYHATNATATTGKLILKNNVFTNSSTARGTGRTAAYYRNNTVLTNYDASSNANLFYAGTPGTSNLIYFDNTNSSQTLAAFQTRVNTREINSVTENVVFLSTVGTSADFLKPDNSLPTYIESKGFAIAGLTDDYLATIRQGNPGYLGTGTNPDLGAYEIEGLVINSPIIVSGALVGNGYYNSLGSAFVAINAGSQTGTAINITVNGDTNEGNFPAILNAGTWNTMTIIPNGIRTITGTTTAGSPLVRLNGADNVTIDGVNITGLSLTFSNTTVAATAGTATLLFTGDATNNTITNCTLLGSTTVPLATAGGVVYFATGITTGNDNNTISNCNIGPAGSNLPSRLIYGSGSIASSAIANSGITITNCNLYDYFLTSGAAAIYAVTGNTDWNITNNKIYQSATRTFTATGTAYGIYFANATFGNNVQITGNSIGYANALGTGTTTYLGSTSAGSFVGIYFQGLPSAATASNLNSNIISDLSLTSSTGNFTGIQNASAASSNTISINSNTIRAISLLTSTGSLTGINWGAATALSASNNTLSGLNRDTAGFLYGIYSATASVTETVSNNTISNLNCNTSGAGTVYGIFQNTSTGTKTIANNIIFSLTGSGGSSIYGVSIGNGTTVNISGNVINDLISTGGVSPIVVGINKTVVATSNIFKNKIYNLSSTASNPSVSGISSSGAASTTTIYNNLIGDLKATLANANNPITGINISLGTTANVYYNTILLNATSSGAVFGSSAVFANTAVTTTLRNNIFINNSVANGAGLSAAYRRSSTTLTSYATTSNNNSFFGTTIYTDGTNTDATLANFKIRMATRDGLSVSENTSFISTVGSSLAFLHVNSSVANLMNGGATTIAGFTSDYDGDIRNVTTPDIGADEFNLVPVITGFTPTALCFSGGTAVTISGFNLNNGSVSVSFNGTLGTITSLSPSTIIVTSPAGLTAGTISVTTSDGSTTSPSSYSVSPLSVAGTVSGNQVICAGTSPTDISITGSIGAIQWQSSLDGISFTDIVGATSSVLTGITIGNLTVTTYYKAVITSGVCSSAPSAIISVSILSTTWNGSSWSAGLPNSTTSAIFTGNYSGSGNLTACDLTVTNSATVIIQTGDTITLNGIVAVDTGSTFTLNNNATLLQNTNSANTGTINVNRDTNPLMRLDYTLWSSPVAGQQLQSFSPATLSNRFYTYDPTSDLYTVVASPATTNFDASTGYLIRVPNTHPVTPTIWTGTFTGVPNNGDIAVTVDNATYNAVGNPYPSKISADDFITANGLTEALYFWRKTNNATTSSYATYTLAGGAGTGASPSDPLALVPNGIIQIGQGFIAKSTSAALNFTNAMRVANSSNQFFRTKDLNRSRIWLDLTAASGIYSQTMIAYMTNATSAVDPALDGKVFNESQTSLTSLINDQSFSVQARALPFANSDVVPLGFRSAIAGNYTITLNHFDGLFENPDLDIFLKDNLTKAAQNLRNGNYTFAAAQGVFNNRFEIVYANPLAVNQNIFDENDVVIYKQNQNLFVNSSSVMLSDIKIFDIQGRLIGSKKDINALETRINLAPKNQILIVRITSDKDGTISKKIIY